MENENLFVELGLTKNEGKVYSELVRHGKLSASEVSSKSSVPYGKVYVVLQSLMDKGFVQTIPEKTKKFVSSDPESLLKVVEEKEKGLEKLKDEIRNLKKFYDKEEKNFLIIGEGDKGFWRVQDQMSRGKHHSYRIKLNSITTKESLAGLRRDLKNGIDIRELVRINKETIGNVRKLMKANPNVREFSNKGVALAFNDNEVLLGLVNKNTTILIRDEALSDVLSRMYLAAYEKAKKVKL